MNTAEQLARMEEYLATQPRRTYPWDGGPEGDTPDLYVSDNEADYRQRQVDAVLSERWSR